MKLTYKVGILPTPSVLNEMKKRIYDYSKQLKILQPTLNDPFITMKVEFEYDGEKISEVDDVLNKISNKFFKFKVSIKKIDSYPKREFHYKIEPSKELKKIHMALLSELGKECLIEPREIEGKYFNFVIPIIFGDLHKDDYDKASKLLEDYYPDIEFEVDNITLFKKEGTFWRKRKSFFLSYN